MDMPNESPLFDSVVVRLGVIGARSEKQYARALHSDGVKPKHVALLAAIDANSARSQVELAAEMRIAASLVVTLADDLEKLGAISRSRDSADRRRQFIELTPAGRQLLARAEAALAKLDRDIADELGDAGEAFLIGLDILATRQGMPAPHKRSK